MQGAAIGGEAPGAWVFVAEHARRGRVGFALGLLTSGLSLGVFLGSLMAISLSRIFSHAQIAAGAWRIPFLIGGVFGFIATWLHRWLKETPVFEAISSKKKTASEKIFKRKLFGSPIGTPFVPAAKYLLNPFPRTPHLTPVDAARPVYADCPPAPGHVPLLGFARIAGFQDQHVRRHISRSKRGLNIQIPVDKLT
jgi:MFS family permease